jgi:hypothetical protein
MIAKAYDRKIQLKEFKDPAITGWRLEQMVLNCKGRYMVKKDFLWGAFVLTTMNGKDLIRPVNYDYVKKYYV